MTKRNHSDLIYSKRLQSSQYSRDDSCEDFLSDHSRILFSSSFRRLARKAQVFSLETNPSVRSRLTHTLEVCDVGRSLARAVARKMAAEGLLDETMIPCVVSIVENACLLHDIGNPPFGHFGESAIKSWFARLLNTQDNLFDDVNLTASYPSIHGILPDFSKGELSDFLNFDGNPQGFRIATRLHCERDHFSLNLTSATLLASIKYPFSDFKAGRRFNKKIGIFRSDSDRYEEICKVSGHPQGKRYFLAYLMELADDCCYCLSDIADSIEKGIVTTTQYSERITELCGQYNGDAGMLAGHCSGTNFNFRFNVAIPLVKRVVSEAADIYVHQLDEFVSGDAPELLELIQAKNELKCLKEFSKRYIYRNLEVQRIELSGYHIVHSLLTNFGRLLTMPKTIFDHFVEQDDNKRNSGFDFEWRLFSRLSPRMIDAYKFARETGNQESEWFARAHLIVDFISGMTDDSAKSMHQILTGSYASDTHGAW